jgi:hypothetical protein
MSRGDLRLCRTMAAPMCRSDFVDEPQAFSAKVPRSQSERIAASRLE